MIGKVRKGADFGRLVDYLMRDNRGSVLALHNLASDSPEAAASEMAVAAALSARTSKPVMHISISYARDEAPTMDEMQDDARRVLRGLGLSENQAVVIRHDDRDHAHFHIAANRVGGDGKAVSDSKSYARIEDTLRQIEAERGWSAIEGRHEVSPKTCRRFEGYPNSRPHRGIIAPRSVRSTLLKASSWPDLHRRLQRDGWRLDVVQAGRGSGAVLTGPDGQRIAAGQVDRQATLAHLRRRLGTDRNARRETLEKSARRQLAWAMRRELLNASTMRMPLSPQNQFRLRKRSLGKSFTPKL